MGRQARLYKTANRRLMLRVLANESPCTAKQTYEALKLAFEMRLYKMVRLPSLIQTHRTLRELTEGGVINRQKQNNAYKYNRR